MITLTVYEFRKLLFDKIIMIFITVLFVTNALTAYFTAQSNARISLPREETLSFFNIYNDDRLVIENEYKERIKHYSEIDKLISERLLAGSHDFEIPNLPNKYIDNENWNDDALYSALYGRISSIENYDSDIQKIINQSYKNIEALEKSGISKDSFSYKYQLMAIDTYSDIIDDVNIHLEYEHGWDKYFEYDKINIYILAAVLILAVTVFTRESQSGFISIIRTSKFGRSESAWAKLTALIISIIAVVVLFSFEAWCIYGLTLGYSSPWNAVQVFEKYRFCPYVITVLQYLMAIVGIRMLVAVAFGLTVAAISVFVSDYSFQMLLGIGNISVNYILSMVTYLEPGNLFNILNVMNAAKADMIFERLNAVNLSGNAIECKHILFAFYFAVIGLSILVSVLKFKYTAAISIISRKTGLNRKFEPIIKRILKRDDFAVKRQIYSKSLVSSELYKSFITTKRIYIFLILAVVKICVSNSCNQCNTTYDDAVYKEYMAELSGELTEVKSNYIETEQDRMNIALESQESMYYAYKNNSMSDEAYIKYIEELNYSISRKSIFEKRIIQQEKYIEELRNEGKEAYFVYDTGWKKIMFPDFDWILFVALLLFSGMFVQEYSHSSSSSSFAAILRLTRKGRESIMKAKLIVSAGVATVMAVLWNFTDFMFICARYVLPSPNAPIYSIREFGSTKWNLKLWQYVLLMYILRVLIWVMLSVVICIMSVLLENNIALITTVATIALLPGLLEELSLNFMKYIDFISFSKVTDMYLQGSTVLSICAITFIVFSSLTFYMARKKWC